MLVAGCGGGESRTASPGKATVAADTSRAGFKPAADGLVTSKQVEMYLKVLERLRARKSAGEAGDALEAAAADAKAAREAGADLDEYLWVKERILEAEASVMTDKLNADVLAMLEKTLGDLRARREKTQDEASRKLLGEQIASFEAEVERTRREAREKEPESVRANALLLQAFRGRLHAQQAELERLVPVAPPTPSTGMGTKGRPERKVPSPGRTGPAEAR